MNIEGWTVEAIMEEIKKVMENDPEPIQGLYAIYQFNLTGDGGGTWQWHLNDGAVDVVQGTAQEPMCTLEISVLNFKKLIMGKLSGTTAYIMGKLKIKGDFGLAMKLDGFLRHYSASRFSTKG